MTPNKFKNAKKSHLAQKSYESTFCDMSHHTNGLALATDNLPTKFEVSISTHNEVMKDDTKCRKWGGLG